MQSHRRRALFFCSLVPTPSSPFWRQGSHCLVRVPPRIVSSGGRRRPCRAKPRRWPRRNPPARPHLSGPNPPLGRPMPGGSASRARRPCVQPPMAPRPSAQRGARRRGCASALEGCAPLKIPPESPARASGANSKRAQTSGRPSTSAPPPWPQAPRPHKVRPRISRGVRRCLQPGGGAPAARSSHRHRSARTRRIACAVLQRPPNAPVPAR
mmetsp:Transcript_101786/g.287088  ORF Transcript_101786/g.287088 Transcript_101786/m.287088 type:complete len:211 (+) Transcript_101786:54-686(+)